MSVQCFARYGGVSIHSVHPSVDDAIAVAYTKGLVVKRQDLVSAVFAGEESLFNGEGVTPVTIEPSHLYDSYWCIAGAEGDINDGIPLQQASDYFEEEDWMLAQFP